MGLSCPAPLCITTVTLPYRFSEAERTEHRFTNNSHHPKLPNHFPIIPKKITSWSVRKGALYHLTLCLSEPENCLLTAASPATWGEGWCLNITMTRQTFRCWRSRPAWEALFPGVAALFQGVVWGGQECQGNRIHKHTTTGPCREIHILINGSSSWQGGTLIQNVSNWCYYMRRYFIILWNPHFSH